LKGSSRTHILGSESGAIMKIAIVDDDVKTRIRLAKMIEQSSHNYNISGCYANGGEALQEIKLNWVDVLITDIRMPIMDGLQLIELLRECNPDIRCIILSGIRNFDYARTAMRIGVVDYLMKPVNSGELYHLLEKIENRFHKPLSQWSDVKPVNNSRIVSLIIKQIEMEYYKEFSLMELSEKVCLNPNYIRQLFKSQKGQSITDYIIHFRIERAKELLKYNLDLKVYEVAGIVGYSDSVYFNRLFKKIVGTTPKEYKERIR
jgi:two-component system response regulator YesN